MTATDPDVLLGARRPVTTPPAFVIEQASDAATLAAYRQLRREVFVAEQGLFGAAGDHDDVDDDPRAVVLVARHTTTGAVLGGVRLAPALPGRDLGWWTGSRLAVTPAARSARAGIGPALVRAACARAESEGVLRFEAQVQAANAVLFARLGWQRVANDDLHGRPHVLMRYPTDRFAALVAATKAPLAGLLTGLREQGGLANPLGGNAFVGDDGAPVPGSDLVAACDAIIPSLVERDPEWAGWCAVLVNVNDLAAMGAAPVGLLDAVAARDASFAARVLAGLRRAAAAYGIAILGGHTQLGVPAALSVTALGRTTRPVPGGGGRPGQHVRLTADLGGGWRPGHAGRQWDSTTSRTPEQLRHLVGWVARQQPAAAKDVSMAGVVGTLGMLAEAGGCAAVLDVAAVPTPAQARPADWLTCFPGFAMLTADAPDRPDLADPGPATSAVCGELVEGAGVRLRWPDGQVTTALTGAVTGLGSTVQGAT